MVSFASPLGAYIHPKGWVRPAGNFEPVITATFADHIAGKRNPGVDIGTGRCGDPIYAMDGGVISLAGLVGFPVANALTVRIRVGEYEPAVTHLETITANPRTKKPWKVGDVVNRGEQIGTLGSSGADACHCHMGMKRLINGVWVEIDGEPLLEQNQEADLDSSFSPKPNKTVTVTKGARHRTAPSLDPATIAIASDPGGPLGFPLLGTVVGAVVSGNSIWYAYWRPETSKVYYLHTSTCGPETPWEQSGHSDAELLAARNDAAQDAAIAVSSAAALKAAQFGTKKV